MATETAECIRCHQVVEYDPEITIGEGGVCCEQCARAETAEREQQAKVDRTREWWERICPARYQDTTVERLPMPDQSQRALDWTWKDGLGLNLWGWPDTGKTRTMYLLLQAQHLRGRKVVVFGPSEFAVELGKRDFKRARWLEGLCKADFLGFDDMDKMTLTRDYEMVFFGLLDKRMAWNKPCIFTHNSTAASLEYQFRSGKSLVRRIRQFTESIYFPSKNPAMLL